jgi:methylthioribulose-1-phosphate dehydratase
MPLTLASAITEILAVGRRLDARGLAPATTGNYSIRLDDGRIAITVSGRHKGRLGRGDVTQIDLDGHPLDAQAPSAEAVLHASVYRLYARAQAVLHVHSVASITLTRLLPSGSDVVLEGYETLKILPGVTTHDTQVVIPVFDNSQDIPVLARAVEARLATLTPTPSALLLRGHGVYAWGASVEEAEHVVEALELMMSCELETLRVRDAAGRSLSVGSP